MRRKLSSHPALMVAEVLKHFSILLAKLTLPCVLGAACAENQAPASRAHQLIKAD